MAWGFLDWVRGRARWRDLFALTLAPNASPHELKQVALFLPSGRRAFDAYQLLREQKESARPVLEQLFKEDARFRDIEGSVPGWLKPPLDVTLGILMEWHSEFAVSELLGMVGATDPRLRAIAARLLATTGQSRFIFILTRLACDTSTEVKEAVADGLDDAIARRDGYELSDELAIALYDLIRDCALRTDQGTGADFAKVLLRIDPERAIADLASESALSIDRRWLYTLIPALDAAGVNIPQARTVLLLSQAIEILGRDDYNRADSFVHRFLIEELICQLGLNDPETARRQIGELRSHPNSEARQGAQDARARLFGDPIAKAYEACAATEGVENLPHELRVVYLVSRLEGQVSNGGWLQWVANSSGQYAAQTLAALHEINAPAAAAELQKVIDMLGPEGSSPIQARRKKAIDKMMSAGKSLPDDDILWDMSNDLKALCCDYADHRPEAFSPRSKSD